MGKTRYEAGSRKTFKSLGLPGAEEHMVKAQLVVKIAALLKERDLNQIEAGKLFGVQ